LEVKAGVNSNNIVFAHGRRDACICSKCKASHCFQKFLEYIEKEQVLYCEKCNSPCKTSVVFFGEGLPNSYFENKEVNYFLFTNILIFFSFFKNKFLFIL
jgi:NAD-dependent SIR2 family protein deacetylase